MKNKRVKVAMFEAGLSQADLAKHLGISTPTLCASLRLELAEEEQDKLVAAVKELEAKRSSCDGNAQA